MPRSITDNILLQSSTIHCKEVYLSKMAKNDSTFSGICKILHTYSAYTPLLFNYHYQDLKGILLRLYVSFMSRICWLVRLHKISIMASSSVPSPCQQSRSKYIDKFHKKKIGILSLIHMYLFKGF